MPQKSKTRRALRRAGHEIKHNPPRQLAKTARKYGANRAEKQRVAILLAKARKAGAKIPKQGTRKRSRKRVEKRS